MIRNRCNIFWADGGIHTKNGGKTYASCASRMMQFPPFLEWITPSTQKYYNDSLNKPPKNTISINFNTERIIRGRLGTWQHVPSGTHRSTSSDTHQVV